MHLQVCKTVTELIHCIFHRRSTTWSPTSPTWKPWWKICGSTTHTSDPPQLTSCTAWRMWGFSCSIHTWPWLPTCRLAAGREIVSSAMSPAFGPWRRCVGTLVWYFGSDVCLFCCLCLENLYISWMCNHLGPGWVRQSSLPIVIIINLFPAMMSLGNDP